MKNNLPRILHKAKFVFYCDLDDLLYIWHGGATVNICTLEGETINCFTNYKLTYQNIDNKIINYLMSRDK